MCGLINAGIEEELKIECGSRRYEGIRAVSEVKVNDAMSFAKLLCLRSCLVWI
jgi:hypothetical protein